MTTLAGRRADRGVRASTCGSSRRCRTCSSFDRTLFVHAGIPREDTLAEKWHDLASLNDPDIRFQMLWSDPSDADVDPARAPEGERALPLRRAGSSSSFMARARR